MIPAAPGSLRLGARGGGNIMCADRINRAAVTQNTFRRHSISLPWQLSPHRPEGQSIKSMVSLNVSSVEEVTHCNHFRYRTARLCQDFAIRWFVLRLFAYTALWFSSIKIRVESAFISYCQQR